jgi:hypothetical protein
MSSNCPENCENFGDKQKLDASWWVALTVFICYFVISSPFLYYLTSFLKSTVKCTGAPLNRAPSWWGWILHSIVAGFLGLGIGYAFMMPGKPVKCSCPVI